MEGTTLTQDLAVILLVAGAVGWLGRWLGFPVMAGYLLAGVLLGPKTSSIAWVKELEAVEALSQVGVIFLMFSIGLKLSLKRLHRLGFSVVLAVAISTGIIFTLTRMAGAAAGLSGVEAMFWAAVLVTSSTAMLGKILQESGDTHEKAGQMAQGVAMVEDVVAVVLLTVLASLMGPTAGEIGWWQTVGVLSAFVVVAGIVGLLVLPALWRRISQSAGEEVLAVGMAGLLFGLALIAQKAGYSVALGAFLLGAIVGETPRRGPVERTFGGMRDVFSAVFFVSIGMQVDGRQWVADWPWVLGIGLFTLGVRTLAVTAGLTLIGKAAKDALRAGLMATAIGEFAFLMMQLGVSGNMIPAKYLGWVVGAALVTTLASPWLARRSERIALAGIRARPGWLEEWHQAYYLWLGVLRARRRRNRLWLLSRKRLIQITVEILFVSGFLVFAEPLQAAVEKRLGTWWPLPGGVGPVFWTVLGLGLLAPLVAIWRNLSALCLILAQVVAAGARNRQWVASKVEFLFKALAALALLFWLVSLLPVGEASVWLLGAVGLLGAVAVGLLRKKLIYWHSELEVELEGRWETRSGGVETATPWLNPRREWQLALTDCVLPDLAVCQGKTLGQLDLRAKHGLTVVGIERQGHLLPLPNQEEAVYAGDKLLLIGPPEQIAQGKAALLEIAEDQVSSEFEDLRMEMLVVPRGSPAAGRTLRELAPAQRHQVQIAGIRRGDTRTLNPSGAEIVGVGEELLVLGTTERINEFKDWLEDAEAESDARA